jgi:hypothetical protein
MDKDKSMKLFDEKTIRTHWDAETETWYFSIVDVCTVLSESADSTAYWRKLKQRLIAEGNETVTNCHGLKMLAEVTTTDITRQDEPETMAEHKNIARRGGSVAKAACVQYEQQTGKKAVSPLNAKNLKAISNTSDTDDN